MTDAVAELVELCHRLGHPANDFALLGEGNAATTRGDQQWVTASGSRLGTLRPDQVVTVSPTRVLAALSGDDLDDDGWTRAMADSRLTDDGVPSIEAPMHAVTAGLTGAAWTAHTHPTPVLGVASSQAWRDFADHPLFPDQIVLCGPRICQLDYVDPGRPLAQATAETLQRFADSEGHWPKVMLMANHGMLAIGETAEEVFNITQMTVKAARVWQIASAAGRPQVMTDRHVRRIHERLDEDVRRRALNASPAPAS